MARLPRFILPGQPQHVIQRGNNRQSRLGSNQANVLKNLVKSLKTIQYLGLKALF